MSRARAGHVAELEKQYHSISTARAKSETMLRHVITKQTLVRSVPVAQYSSISRVCGTGKGPQVCSHSRCCSGQLSSDPAAAYLPASRRGAL